MSDIPFTCKICGLPGSVNFTPTGQSEIDDFILKFAAMMVHDHCAPPEPKPRPKQLALKPVTPARVPYTD